MESTVGPEGVDVSNLADAPRDVVIETLHSIQIGCAPEDILEWVLDHRKQEQWLDDLVESESTSAGAPAVGSTYHQVVQIGGRLTSLTGEVTEYQPPHRLSFRSHIRNMTITSEWEFTPLDNGGTMVNFVERSSMPGMVFNLMAPLIRLAMRRRYRVALAKLKRLAEASAR